MKYIFANSYTQAQVFIESQKWTLGNYRVFTTLQESEGLVFRTGDHVIRLPGTDGLIPSIKRTATKSNFYPLDIIPPIEGYE